jgi:hypothetical protein
MGNLRFEFGFARSNTLLLNYLNPRKDVIINPNDITTCFGLREMWDE